MKMRQYKILLNILKTIWFFIGAHKIKFMIIVGFGVIASILESLNVAIMYPMINNALDLKASTNPVYQIIDSIIRIIPINDQLIQYAIAFIFIAIISFLLKTIYFFLSAKLYAQIVMKTKKKLFNKYEKTDYQLFIDNKQGEIQYKISIAPIRLSYMLHVLIEMFLSLFLAFSVFIVLFLMSWKLLLIVVIFGLIYFYGIKQISTRISYRTGKNQRDSWKKEQVLVSEYTSGVKQIKIYGTSGYWKRLFNKTMDTYWYHNRKNYFWNKLPSLIPWTILYLSIGGAIAAIKLLFPENFIELIPFIGTFAVGVFLVLPKIATFGSYITSIMNFLPDVEMLHEELQDKQYSSIKNGTKSITSLNQGISIKNVSFSHKNREILLKNINMEIRKNTVTALVGPSGSGKSTIINLLLRLYDTKEGSIYIDNINIKNLKLSSYLRLVGYVSQDTFIFNGSIKENISFGKNYSDDEIIDAAKKANAHDFIKELPKKYDTIVGDRGMRLSGGEQQRIAIARAIIRKPEVMIMDEATSSLDNVSEAMVKKAIDDISKSCTTFIVAHRLSTIQNADVIYVLYDGKIVESGTHEELLRNKSHYFHLYQGKDNVG